jgi:hypothetical protein
MRTHTLAAGSVIHECEVIVAPAPSTPFKIRKNQDSLPHGEVNHISSRIE